MGEGSVSERVDLVRRHAREGGHPVHTAGSGVYWVPAFAGTTKTVM